MHGCPGQGVVSGCALSRRGRADRGTVRHAGSRRRPPPRKPSKEGPFGETWRRKQYLQSQGIPQARAALERNQRECAAAPAEAIAHAGPLRRGNLPQGSQFVQEQEAAGAKDKAACEARSEELRQQLNALEKELEGL